MNSILRNYKSEDISHIVNLFRDTVHTINAKDYTKAQLNAWAPECIDAERWGVKLSQHYTLVAECDGVICGFGDMDNTGYFDHLFVHKDYQGQGVATKIATAIEEYAQEKGFTIITVAASITAQPFFLKRGYTVVREQQVEHNGQTFTNFFMEKRF
ncbi:GNAT family N-acetyltransferase [Flavobacterium arcticum]|uniref:GNAT family N-acetyltransferase n=1 Tax=Flavobacterium arcticum TaxID=1784713 RepID=A0A345HCD7_9FLAO|nr:GNAT family N-acetyltransferase [Flavobacterium arcticum]AXG74247.1 GNAT family N-acetyltransferase [Flavobacterium arcticum]KAF2508166.1 GNAT family N-acetyltransferase [Flavobacterium arcticum]